MENLKSRLADLNREKDRLAVQIQELCIQHEKASGDIVLIHAEIDNLVNVPVHGGQDPTLWLPDELLEIIFLYAPFLALWNVLACVCRRWKRIVRNSPILKKRRKEERWTAYEKGEIEPRVLKGHTAAVYCLVLGPDDKLYSGSRDGTIRIWSTIDGSCLKTIDVQITVYALAIGLDGKLYSTHGGENIIRVWSDNACVQKLHGHTDDICTIAVGLDGSIFSGSDDCTIRVWAGMDGTHLCTLEGHTANITAIVVGLDGKIYSSSFDTTIRVWFGVDFTCINVFTCDDVDYIDILAVGSDNYIYFGAQYFIYKLSGIDGSVIQTFDEYCHNYSSLVMGVAGTFFSSSDNVILVWSSTGGSVLHKISGRGGNFSTLVMGANGRLYSGTWHNNIYVW